MIGGRVAGGAAGAVTGTMLGDQVGDPLVGSAVGTQGGQYFGAKYGRIAAEQMADVITKGGPGRGERLMRLSGQPPWQRNEF